MAEHIHLVGDIGGTNARFALVAEDRGYHSERVFNCADYPGAEAAISAYLRAADLPEPDAICLATAGHIENGVCRFTNNHWVVSEAELRRAFNCQEVVLLNDFVAVAYSLPGLHADHCLEIGPGLPTPDLSRDFCLGVVGPGTGLGAGALIHRGSRYLPIESEAGHIGFAPETALQRELLECLARRFERVSCERLLSGPGIENIHRGLAEVLATPVEPLTAARVFARSSERPDGIERRTTDLFFEVLGQVAGDLALAFGSGQGMYIGGGIAQRYPELLRASGFRAGFVAKGRHRALLERTPTYLVQHPLPGLFGAAEYLRLSPR